MSWKWRNANPLYAWKYEYTDDDFDLFVYHYGSVSVYIGDMIVFEMEFESAEEAMLELEKALS